MGKKSTGKKPATAKAKKDSAQRKPNMAEISDAQREAGFNSYKRALKPLFVAEKNAKNAVKNKVELAKKELGFTRKDFELAIQLETDEGKEKLANAIQKQLDIDRYMGKAVGKQLELFAKESSAEVAFELGRHDALDDKPAKPPAHYAQAAQQNYLEGHARGRALLNDQRLGNFKGPGNVTQIGDAAARVADKIGDASPTHQDAA